MARDMVFAAVGVGTCAIISKEGCAVQSWVNGIGLIAGCHHWDDPLHNRVYPKEAETVGIGTWWLLSIPSLLLCSVLLGLHWVDCQIYQQKCIYCGTFLYSPCIFWFVEDVSFGETDVKLSISLPCFLKLELMHKFSMQIATSGKGFCRAAGKASALIVSNILKVAAVNILGDLILFLGKVCVSLVCALFAFLMLETHKYKSGNSQVSSPLFPVLVSNYPIPHPLMHTTLNPVWPLWRWPDSFTRCRLERKLTALELGLGCACVVLLGSRLHHCWPFLCSCGDGNWHNSVILLHRCRWAQWHCHVCTSFAHRYFEIPCRMPRGSSGRACFA